MQDLAKLLKLKEPTVSHHLAILREAGLVQMRTDGNTHWYRLDFETLHSVSRTALTREKLASIANDLDADDWERKVLSNFMDGERIKDIPVARKKRWAILKWLADGSMRTRSIPKISSMGYSSSIIGTRRRCGAT